MNLSREAFQPRILDSARWTRAFGYTLFIGLMAVGYYYNLTFVQLGLVDLGTRLIGMGEQSVAAYMAVLALVTGAAAVAFGLAMQRSGWSQRFVVKLRFAFAVVLVQTVLTAIAPQIRSELPFLLWIGGAAIALGVGVPVTFSMTTDLIARRHRGHVAAAVTALAYFFAAAFSGQWEVENFAGQLVGLMLIGAIGLGVMGFKRLSVIEALSAQHADPAFGRGRFVVVDEYGREHVNRSVIGLLILMFGVYFVDSLGFLRIIVTPALVDTAWQSPDSGVRMFIAVTHVVAAVVAGVLYTAFPLGRLFLWIFGLFALVHLMYTFPLRVTPADEGAVLAMPMLYAIVVSLYTVVNFAVWADISTPRSISRNAALGVGLAAWTATFISTSLAMWWGAAGVNVDTHLRIVNAVATSLFLVVLAVFFFQRPLRSTRSSRRDE